MTITFQRIRMPENIEYPTGKPPRVRFVISDELQEAVGTITGKNRKVANLRESVGTYDPTEQKRRIPEIKGRLRAIIDRAEQMVKQRSLPPCLDIAEILAQHEQELAATRQVLAMMQAGEITIPAREEIEDVKRQVDAEFGCGPMVDVTPKRATLDQAISDWKKKHGPWRDAAAERKSEQAKRRAAESLFQSAGTTDMAAITTVQLQHWVDGLHDRQAYDFVSDVKMLYRRLEVNNRLIGVPNPCVKNNGTPAIETPLKPDHTARNEFSPERAAKILAAASISDDPLLKWGPLIMAHSGMIATEFVYAPTSEIQQKHGVWVWHVGDQGRILKTGRRGHRSRVIPLHPVLLAAGFLDFARSRGDGLLFDTDNTRASAALMAQLRGLGIEGNDQVCYSWRHGFISRLVHAGVDPTLRRYLDGHGLGGNIDERHYIHHQMTKMVAAINGVDPTAPYDDDTEAYQEA